jgi:hypothetical protein
MPPELLPGDDAGTLRVGDWLTLPVPVRLCLLGEEPVEATYDDLRAEGATVVASATVEAPDGTRVEVVDRWEPDGADAVRIDRVATVLAAGAAAVVRLELRAETAAAGARRHEDWQFFIPGALYNRNDTDHDGVEDYLGTYVQDYRDDRLASLAVLAYLPSARRYAALTRCDVPAFDTAIAPEDLVRREVVQETDIGSLGLAPGEDAAQIGLRAGYPFAEASSYCLTTDGDGWAGYRENRAGARFEVSYALTVAAADDLTDALWDITQRQMTTLGTRPPALPYTFEASLEQRNLLTQQYYREWSENEDASRPAGYRVHFSPRSGVPQGALLEYGFSGAQTLLAWASIANGYAHGVPLWTQRARRVIDFFVARCQLDNGFSHGIYDTDAQVFVTWFTGVLMPFQYADDEEQLARYLGEQVTRALAPIAAELRGVEGNYTRTMCESIYPLLLAYRVERDHGTVHDHWLEAGRRFGDFLLRTQSADGAWHRAYDPSGRPLTSPPQWFGATDAERKSGTIFPIQVLVTLHELTGERAYLDAAARAGDFIAATYVDPVEYIGGLNDTTHVKSVKTDSVGVMFVMRSLIKLHEHTQDERHLRAAVKAAKALASWVYLWDVPFPEGTLLGASDFRSTGWAVCDVLPAGSYLDNELLEFTGDLVHVAARSGDERLFDVAEIVQHGMQLALSMPEQMLGYVAPGIQCEGIMTAYWLSEPEHTEFSGAVNKVKGDDNDTCNGLTNGQAAYAAFELLERYGSTDFRHLRGHLFPDRRPGGGTGPRTSSLHA